MEEYVLGSGPALAAAAPARDTNAATVGPRRLDLAPYLATTAIVVRRGSRIVTSGFRRWGEEPSAGIMRSLAVSLGAASNVRAVDVAPWPRQAQHDDLVQLHISHLEGVAAEEPLATTGEVQVIASWEIMRSADGMLVARGTADRRESGWTVGDYAGLVTRIDKGLTGLAGDVAACLVRVVSSKAAPDAVTGTNGGAM